MNKKSKSNQKKSFVFRKGMSFVEAILSIFIFSLIMLAVTTIFTGSFKGYKKSEKMAKNIENAQYAMNLMAKTLRTSSILDCSPTACGASPVEATEIRFFDHSQPLCGKYVFANGKVMAYRSDATITDSASCVTTTNFTGQDMLNVYAPGKFRVVGSATVSPTDKRMGKVTIQMEVCSNANCTGINNDKAFLQTTSSLRDYGTVDL